MEQDRMLQPPASPCPPHIPSGDLARARANGAASEHESFWRVRDSASGATPDAASARLTWESGEGRLDYLATAGYVDVRDDTGRLQAKMFCLSYVSVDQGSCADRRRPVTFCYNGGPGCASVPINFGGFGPLRVRPAGRDHLRFDAPVEDNPYTVLKYSDLVFLDAPGTGFSPLAEGQDSSSLFGIDGDADAFCRAIAAWLELNGRWDAPLYLLGESYGTLRNAVLMRLLGERGIKLVGVIMLSAIWDWVQTLPGEDLYYLGMLPTFAATAQYFNKAGIGRDADEFFDEAMDFTEHRYAPALLLGDRLDKQEECKMAQYMSRMIGLPESFIVQRHLRVSLEDFRARLLYEEGKVTGRLDTRFTSDAPGYQQQSWEWFAGEDAADDVVNAVWNRAFRSFIHQDLGFKAPARYLDNNYHAVGEKWDWSHEAPGTGQKVGAPNVAIDIACALRRDPTIKLCVLGGRFDAATTYWNVVHDLSAQFLSSQIQERVEFHRYGCGHMAYVDEPSLAAIDKDLAAFYAKQ
ncbi:MAG: peptidase S10 [Olegusella sp.]|jgi:carboxypeptidase C (cathepsin A)|nr:peptidase S10 [Olegusella sp.]